jgi:hypothetical protein
MKVSAAVQAYYDESENQAIKQWLGEQEAYNPERDEVWIPWTGFRTFAKAASMTTIGWIPKYDEVLNLMEFALKEEKKDKRRKHSKKVINGALRLVHLHKSTLWRAYRAFLIFVKWERYNRLSLKLDKEFYANGCKTCAHRSNCPLTKKLRKQVFDTASSIEIVKSTCDVYTHKELDEEGKIVLLPFAKMVMREYQEQKLVLRKRDNAQKIKDFVQQCLRGERNLELGLNFKSALELANVYHRKDGMGI